MSEFSLIFSTLHKINYCNKQTLTCMQNPQLPQSTQNPPAQIHSSWTTAAPKHPLWVVKSESVWSCLLKYIFTCNMSKVKNLNKLKLIIINLYQKAHQKNYNLTYIPRCSTPRSTSNSCSSALPYPLKTCQRARARWTPTPLYGPKSRAP